MILDINYLKNILYYIKYFILIVFLLIYVKKVNEKKYL